MLKTIIHAAAWRTESLWDRIKGQRDERRIIEPYSGYATPEHLVVRGRVLTSLRRGNPKPDQSRWTNFKQMFSLFLTDEVGGVEVSAAGSRAKTDEEGYFTLHIPRTTETGWVDIDVRLGTDGMTARCPVLIPRADAHFGVISDIDDTMLETGAYSLVRNLWTSFTGNVATRRIFPDAVDFMNDLSKMGQNPIFYVSSSPWNLHHFLERIFDRAGLVKGPKFLRDLGLSESKFVTGTHGDHKGDSIDTILAANPDLNFILVGDTGQHDANVYRDAISRHPDRVRAVVLREPGPGPDAESRTAMDEISATGAKLLQGPDFDGFAGILKAGDLG